jgi:hypothetical protein
MNSGVILVSFGPMWAYSLSSSKFGLCTFYLRISLSGAANKKGVVVAYGFVKVSIGDWYIRQ